MVQPTHVQSWCDVESATRLLAPEGLAVERVERDPLGGRGASGDRGRGGVCVPVVWGVQLVAEGERYVIGPRACIVPGPWWPLRQRPSRPANTVEEAGVLEANPDGPHGR